MTNQLSPTRGGSDFLAVGFGTTVAMWSVGYFCRLFGDTVPPVLLFALLMTCLLIGGVVIGRAGQRGIRGGVLAGLIAGLLSLLVVGSLISGDTPNAIRTGALLWVPGTLVICIAIMTLGCAIGGTVRRAPTAPPPDWPGALAAVAAIATFVLLAAGGLVTGFDEGLAVVDWPNSEGYNMFLYPLSKMSGGVYLEHAHRLLGSLVGLTTLVLAFHIQLTERRPALKALAWTALALVIVQGVLGGLRVTGRFTMSTDPSDTNPRILLAIVHGVLGQIVFAVLVTLAVVRSRRWAGAQPAAALPSVPLDRQLSVILVVVLIAQLVLGALTRHFTWALDIQRNELALDPERIADIGQRMLHLHLAMAVVVGLAIVGLGVRAWGLYERIPILHRLGLSMLVLLVVQVALGIAAYIVTGNDAATRRPTAVDVAITTSHQVVGAALLAWGVMLALWLRRIVEPARGGVTAPAT
jgi:cytochrome c oxidase assembly protein subunit 15